MSDKDTMRFTQKERLPKILFRLDENWRMRETVLVSRRHENLNGAKFKGGKLAEIYEARLFIVVVGRIYVKSEQTNGMNTMESLVNRFQNCLLLFA